MSLASRIIEYVNASLKPLLESGEDVPPDFRLLTEEDLATLTDDAIAAVAEVIFAAVVLPMVYPEPEADPETLRLYEEAFEAHPHRIAQKKSIARFDEEGMNGMDLAETGSTVSSLLSHILVRQSPWEGALWKPQGDEDHLRNADGTPLKEGGPWSKKNTAASLRSFELAGDYYEFCDQISMTMNQLGDVEMISGILPGILVELKEDGVLFLTVDPVL